MLDTLALRLDEMSAAVLRGRAGGRAGRRMTPRPTVRARFRQVVARGLARADREIAEHHARIRALPTLRRDREEWISELRRKPRRRP
jgi:hypothetical protein